MILEDLVVLLVGHGFDETSLLDRDVVSFNRLAESVLRVHYPKPKKAESTGGWEALARSPMFRKRG